MSHRLLCVAAALLFAACEGPAGPMGPTGPAGEPGPGTRITLSATVGADGVGGVNLPSEAGSIADPPGLTCYLGETPSSPHFVIGLDIEGPTCALAQGGGNLQAIIIDAPVGWSVRFTVVY